MKSTTNIFIILIIWVIAMAPMCTSKQVEGTTKIITKSKAGKKVLEKVDDVVGNLFKRTRVITVSKVLFKVIDASGTEVQVLDPRLKTEILTTKAAIEYQLVEVANKFNEKLTAISRENGGNVSNSDRLLAFYKTLDEIKGINKNSYILFGAYIIYDKPSYLYPTYWIRGTVEV